MKALDLGMTKTHLHCRNGVKNEKQTIDSKMKKGDPQILIDAEAK